MNFFNTSLALMDAYDNSHMHNILFSIKEGAKLVNERFRGKLAELQKKKDYLVV